MPRIDAAEKISGRTVYAADVTLPGLLHLAVVRSPFPHARILSVDTAEAAALPGVCCVLTGADMPDALFGRRVRDVPLLARGHVHFAGEAVAAVAADTRDQAERAAGRVRVEYEPLPFVADPEDALRPGAPAVHDAPWEFPGAVVTPSDPPNLQSRLTHQRGDVDAALAASWAKVDLTFHTTSVHQGYLEPQSCVARAGPDGSLEIWAANKSPYRLRAQLAAGFNLPEGRIIVHPLPVGGDFGGKGAPMYVPLCAAAAQRTGRPVRLVLRYSEDLASANPRHAARIRVRAGAGQDGRLLALDVRAVFDGGAYAGFKPIPGVNLHGAEEAGSSYRIPCLRIESLVAYTHTVPRGHMRAPGAPQTVFAVESALDELARATSLDPAVFRRLNLLRTGEPNPLGETWQEARGVETLDAALAAVRPLEVGPGERRGVGIAVYNRPTPVGRTSLTLQVTDDVVTALVPIPETGTGSHTVVRDAVARGLAIDPERVRVQHVSTAVLPHDDGVGGSRVTASMSEAVRLAVERLRAQEGRGSVTVVVDPEKTRPVVSFCVQVAQVGVDVETGRVTVYEVLTAVDVASVLNPSSHRIQIEGGVAMGFGFACLEDLAILEGQVTAAYLGEYKLPSYRDVPRMPVVLVPGGDGVGTHNVKAIAELSNVPTAAAIANAVSDAVGARMTRLPISAETVYEALHSGETA
jgi:CO/xanthine dehydrogenase Mo-binding subunit